MEVVVYTFDLISENNDGKSVLSEISARREIWVDYIRFLNGKKKKRFKILRGFELQDLLYRT